MFRSTDIEAMLGVKRQTLSNWCAEFEGYLSPAARPEPGGWRRFNHDDIAVINNIWPMRRKNGTCIWFNLAHANGFNPSTFKSKVKPANPAKERGML
jgi:hypothetical protein